MNAEKRAERRLAKARRKYEAVAAKAEDRHLEELRRASLPDIEKSIESINTSADVNWLTSFRARMITAGVSEIVTAIDKRLVAIEEMKFRKSVAESSIAGLNLQQRVWESVRVYELFLARKHNGKNIKASRTRDMIKRLGEKEAAARTVRTQETSTGLETLAEYDRLDCSYEQIILDFPNEFDTLLRAKARANLDGLLSRRLVDHSFDEGRRLNRLL